MSRAHGQVWDAPLPALHASADPAIIKRGEYLVYGPSHCVECHALTPDRETGIGSVSDAQIDLARCAANCTGCHSPHGTHVRAQRARVLWRECDGADAAAAR